MMVWRVAFVLILRLLTARGRPMLYAYDISSRQGFNLGSKSAEEIFRPVRDEIKEVIPKVGNLIPSGISSCQGLTGRH